MIRFECDYTEGAHPKILDALVRTNSVQTPGYGADDYCETARKIIRLACGNDEMDVHFLVGGTQANTTVISAALRPHQAVIAPASGHIAEHETGAVEATGHKVISLPTDNGKITAEQVRKVVEDHWNDASFEHMPQPAMVYISQPTETGQIYSKQELRALRYVCDEKKLLLFADGARLGYALAARGNDVFMADLAELCDVFYIGGTKVGAMFGEAVCIVSDALKTDFRYHIKQRGGMLAKGRFLGIQFDALFRDGLYMEISRHAIEQAMRIRDAFAAAGCKFLFESPTNQQFPIVNSLVYEEISKKYTVTLWKKLPDGKICIRLVTSWATSVENVDNLLADIAQTCWIYGDNQTFEPVETEK